MKPELGICWDYAGTLTRGYSLREGLPETLQRLSDRGIAHIVTSGAFTFELEEELKDFGIRGHFLSVLGRESVCRSYGKDYRVAAKVMGFSAEEAVRRLVVIGDREDDKPFGEMEDMVFIFQKDGSRQPASMPEDVITHLLKNGKAFKAGFDEIYGSGHEAIVGSRLVQLRRNLVISLSYEGKALRIEIPENAAY